MPLPFRPTPHQAGRVMGRSIQALIEQFRETLNEQWLGEAELSSNEYMAELFLVSAASAMHAVESSRLSPEVEYGVASGFYEWIRGLPGATRDLLSAQLETATDYYAEAARNDSESTADAGQVSDMEMAFGDRLLSRGEDNERRGSACLKLAVVLPSTLWSTHYKSACQVLRDASLVIDH